MMHDFKVMFFPTVVSPRQKSIVAAILSWQHQVGGCSRLGGSGKTVEKTRPETVNTAIVLHAALFRVGVYNVDIWWAICRGDGWTECRPRLWTVRYRSVRLEPSIINPVCWMEECGVECWGFLTAPSRICLIRCSRWQYKRMRLFMNVFLHTL